MQADPEIDISRYEEYKTTLKKLNYRAPQKDEEKFIKRYNRISCSLAGGVVLVITVVIIYLMQIKNAPAYAYIVPGTAVLYSLREFFHIVYSRYGVFDGEIVAKFTGSENHHYVGVWSKKERQFCRNVPWRGKGWYDISPGERIKVYKINRKYFTIFPLHRQEELKSIRR